MYIYRIYVCLKIRVGKVGNRICRICVSTGPPSFTSVAPSSLNSKGGRPKSTTYANKKKNKMAVVATLNKIAHIYCEEKKAMKNKKKKMR